VVNRLQRWERFGPTVEPGHSQPGGAKPSEKIIRFLMTKSDHLPFKSMISDFKKEKY